MIAIASARKCRQFSTGATAYKPLIRFKTDNTRESSRVVGRGSKGNQGETYLNKADAIARAARHIAEQRATVRAQALRGGRTPSATRTKWLQGQFEMWGGDGDVFALAPEGS